MLKSYANDISTQADLGLLVIYLVRHGETVWNIAGRQQGRLDSALTASGIAQARAVGRLLRRSVVVESSPLRRAEQTATLLCVELGLAPSGIVDSPLLTEQDLGVWQGLTFSEIDERYPGALRQRETDKWTYRIEGGESYALISERARQWLGLRKAPVTIAVTHEMMSRTLQGAYAGLSPQETLRRSHRQDRMYCLADGRVTEVAVE